MTGKQDEATEITLGGQKFKVEALTLDQLQEALPQLERLSKANDIGERIRTARAAIAVALKMGDAELGALHVKLKELLDAVAVIGRVSGLEELGEMKPATAPRAS